VGAKKEGGSRKIEKSLAGPAAKAALVCFEGRFFGLTHQKKQGGQPFFNARKRRGPGATPTTTDRREMSCRSWNINRDDAIERRRETWEEEGENEEVQKKRRTRGTTQTQQIQTRSGRKRSRRYGRGGSARSGANAFFVEARPPAGTERRSTCGGQSQLVRAWHLCWD